MALLLLKNKKIITAKINQKNNQIKYFSQCQDNENG